jgi:hypothetical protein
VVDSMVLIQAGKRGKVKLREEAIVVLLAKEEKFLTKNQIASRLNIDIKLINRSCTNLRKMHILVMHRKKWWGLVT